MWYLYHINQRSNTRILVKMELGTLNKLTKNCNRHCKVGVVLRHADGNEEFVEFEASELAFIDALDDGEMLPIKAISLGTFKGNFEE